MTKDEAKVILNMPEEEAVAIILDIADKAEKYDKMQSQIYPSTPSGMTPVYLKPNKSNNENKTKKRNKKPGRKKGHQGFARKQNNEPTNFKEHKLENCPDCGGPLKQESTKSYTRNIEDIPPVKPEVTEHTVNGYWCSKCKKVVYPKVTEALNNSTIGLRVYIYAAWLHYLLGVSLSNVVRILSVFSSFKITTGGLTQAWIRIASMLETNYKEIGVKVSASAVLHADETGWRISGETHWLWCFATKSYCYYIISKSRGSPVLKEFFGAFFSGILICDFWGAYNKICALAKQRCLYHLFTELIKVDKKNNSFLWKMFRKKLSRLLKDAIRLSSIRTQISSTEFRRLKNKLYKRLEQFLKSSCEDQDAKRLIKRLSRHKNELFTFLDYKDVSPYNNHAEQQMRKPVITRKISQQNRSDMGAKTQSIFMTLFRSAELQNLNPVETVLSISKKSIPQNVSISDFYGIAA